MNKRLSKVIVTLFILLGFVAPVTAADYTLTTEQAELETCPSMFVPFEILVTNTGDAPDVYTISKAGTAAHWTIVSPPGFVLNPGDSQAVIAYITPSKFALPGTYSIKITATADDGETRTIEGRLKVTKCHNVELIAEEITNNICSGSADTYDFTIVNTGKWTETYQLSVFGLGASWATLDKELVQLQEDESEDLTLTVSVPEGRTGPATVTVTAKSLDSSAAESVSFTANAQSCYDFELNVDSNYYSFCENSEARIPIELSNLGVSPDTYDLSISGPNWASLDRTRLRVNGESDDSLNLILTPGYGVQGTSSVRITAESQNSPVSDVLTLDANIFTCYGVTLNLDKESDSMCPGTENSYEVSVTNTGNFTESYTVKAIGASWVDFDESFITLKAGESEVMNMVLSPSLTVNPGKYMINIAAQAQGASQTSDTKIMDVSIATKASCFGVAVTPKIKKIDVAYGEGALIPVIVENIGSQPVTYNLDVAGTGAVLTQLNPATLDLEGNSAGRAYLYISVPVQTEKQKYEVIVTARDSETEAISSSATITITLVDEPTEPIEFEEEELVTEEEGEEQLGFFSRIRVWFSNLFSFGEEAEEEPVVEEEVTEAESILEELPEEVPEEEVTAEEITGEAATDEELTEIIEAEFEEELAGEEAPEEVPSDEVPEEEDEIEAPPIKVREDSIMQRFTDFAVEFWYIVIIIIIIIILIIMIIRAGLFEVKDIEEILKEEQKPKKTAKKPEKKTKGAWSKFKDWLDEEEIESKPVKTKSSKEPEKKAKKKGKGIFQKFKDWLEEE